MKKKPEPRVSGGHTVGQKYFDNQSNTDRSKQVTFETYAPTSHTSNQLTTQVLDVMPQMKGTNVVGKPNVAGELNVVGGGLVKVLSSETAVPLKKGQWSDGPELEQNKIEEHTEE
jgi:hypothetical protein